MIAEENKDYLKLYSNCLIVTFKLRVIPLPVFSGKIGKILEIKITIY